MMLIMLIFMPALFSIRGWTNFILLVNSIQSIENLRKYICSAHVGLIIIKLCRLISTTIKLLKVFLATEPGSCVDRTCCALTLRLNNSQKQPQHKTLPHIYLFFCISSMFINGIDLVFCFKHV